MTGLPDVYVWSAVAGLVGVVFVTRNLFVVLPDWLQPRGVLERALRFAPLAALVALTVPSATAALFVPGTDLWAVIRDGRLPAALAALAVARWRGSPLPGLLAGVVVLFAAGALP